MANVKKIEGKNGVSYKITVTHGRDTQGKQVRHYKTWVPPVGMSQKKAEKEAQKVAFEFEQQIEQGFQLDNRQTFAQYAEYVIEVKEQEGKKRRTLDRYKELLERINPVIGGLKLTEIRPQHLNSFYKSLSAPGTAKQQATATATENLGKAAKEMTRAALAKKAGIAPTTVTAAMKGHAISYQTAISISAALGKDMSKLFNIHQYDKGLSAKTILEHHRLIGTILAQAEKEMLVPYNAAAKATPPKAEKHDANYFQLQDIVKIRAALEDEPLKWKVITHLLMITGCRRGEIMGLRWDRVDFEQNRVRIDSALLYSPKRGIYEDTTKTGNVRYIKLPLETMTLLRKYRVAYMELRLKNGDRWKDTGYLFTKDNGEPMIPDSITAWLRDFSTRHDLPHINPHAFRHTMASVLISNGQDVVSVSKRLGHAKVSTTTDIYSHIIQEADSRATECLADILLRTGTK